jgi:hypothetical protein
LGFSGAPSGDNWLSHGSGKRKWQQIESLEVRSTLDAMAQGQVALCKSCAIAILEYGHISQRVRRSGVHPPANRHSGKTSFLNPRDWSKFITQQRPSQDLSCYESKALRGSKSAMGKAKTYWRQ